MFLFRRKSVQRLAEDTIKELAEDLDFYRTRYLNYYRAIIAAQRGMKRLHRKLEVRDAYIAVMEKAFFSETGASASSAEIERVRQNLGLMKKPRPSNLSAVQR